MNHHLFRLLIKDMPSKILKNNNINPAHFKAVCFIISMYGTYENGTSIFPSWLTVGKEAGVDRKTAMKVRDFLIKNGLLIEVSKRMKNISEYKFGEVSDELSNLIYDLSNLDNELSNSSEQLSNLNSQLSNNSGHNTIIDTTNDSTKDINKDIDNQEKKEVKVIDYPLIQNDNVSWEELIEWDDEYEDDQMSKFDYPDEELVEPEKRVERKKDINTLDDILNGPFVFGKI
jgi:hypothetical protein